jgi:cytidylate kinase
MPKINIAIDGFSSCGKSTIAKELAALLHYKYIDTGAMYRALALYAIRKELKLSDGSIDIQLLENEIMHADVDFHLNKETKKSEVFLNDEAVEPFIRTLELGNLASTISKYRFVRNKLQKLQKKIGLQKGVIMDGRDIGTVIMPHAELKIFMIADPEIRAERRMLELGDKGSNVSKKEVMEMQRIRDHEDLTREEDPLKRADDAVVLDNSYMTKEQQLNYVIELVEHIKVGSAPRT